MREEEEAERAAPPPQVAEEGLGYGKANQPGCASPSPQVAEEGRQANDRRTASARPSGGLRTTGGEVAVG